MGPCSAIAPTPIVAAMIEHTAATTTNLTTSSPLSNSYMPPTWRRMSAAPASASSVLPHAIRAAVKTDASTIALTTATPTHSPGQIRLPKRSVAATAMPEGGQTAVAKPGGIAKNSESFAAAKYAAATTIS